MLKFFEIKDVRFEKKKKTEILKLFLFLINEESPGQSLEIFLKKFELDFFKIQFLRNLSVFFL